MRIERLGDSALLLRDASHPAYELAEWLNKGPVAGCIEAIASYETVGVYFSRPISDFADVSARLAAAELELVRSDLRKPNTHQIPVCYEMGDDMGEVCEALRLPREEVARLHCSVEFHCFAIGFCPGFPYLGYLPEALEGLPRRATPRVRIPPGSVAITGRQTGIYPLERPGGWAIIGRTPLTIVDQDAGYFPICAGDRVRFLSIGVDEFEARLGKRL